MSVATKTALSRALAAHVVTEPVATAFEPAVGPVKLDFAGNPNHYRARSTVRKLNRAKPKGAGEMSPRLRLKLFHADLSQSR